nr:IS5 family transposase [Victivallis sp. Marseille-Q1083]
MAMNSWEVSDAFWSKVEPLIPRARRDSNREYQRRRGAGRKPLEARRVFEGIVYVLRTGIQWKALPREYGSSSSIHRYFQRWLKAGLFQKLWKKGLAEYDELEGISWRWQSIDGAMNKAPLAREAVGPNPTDKGKKNGTKRHVLVDERGIPLSIVVTRANRNDVTQVNAVLSARMRKPRGRTKQNLCADAGYTGSGEVMKAYRYIPHIRPRGEEKIAVRQGYKARRWIVEVAHSWFNRFRKLLVRFEKTHAAYEALLQLAASVIIYRKLAVI